jgi:alanyl-tRNA synthetase
MEGLTSKDTIDKYLSNQIALIQSDINKMYEDVNNANALTDEFTTLVKATSYRNSAIDLLKLRKHLETIQTVYHKIMLEVHKQNIGNQKLVIKSLINIPSQSKQILYGIYEDGDNKVINHALTELANENKDHAFVLFNKTSTKLQYIIIANKTYVDQFKFDANQIVKKINELTGGSGGGRNQFAQGGTNQINKLDEMINYIKSL